jgi:hypothetical protein
MDESTLILNLVYCHMRQKMPIWEYANHHT